MASKEERRKREGSFPGDQIRWIMERKGKPKKEERKKREMKEGKKIKEKKMGESCA